MFLWQFYFIFSWSCVKMSPTTEIQDNNDYKNPKKVWKWLKNELNCQNNNFSFNFLHVWTRKSKVVWRKAFNYGSKSAKNNFFLSNYRIGWKSGSHHGFIGKLALFPGLAHPPKVHVETTKRIDLKKSEKSNPRLFNVACLMLLKIFQRHK